MTDGVHLSGAGCGAGGVHHPRHPVLSGWLYTATQHAAAKAIRAEVRRHVREQAASAMQPTSENAPLGETAGIDWQRVRLVLDDAMRELGERDREAVLLRFFARRPFAEIGAMLNLLTMLFKWRASAVASPEEQDLAQWRETPARLLHREFFGRQEICEYAHFVSTLFHEIIQGRVLSADQFGACTPPVMRLSPVATIRSQLPASAAPPGTASGPTTFCA